MNVLFFLISNIVDTAIYHIKLVIYIYVSNDPIAIPMTTAYGTVGPFSIFRHIPYPFVH